MDSIPSRRKIQKLVQKFPYPVQFETVEKLKIEFSIRDKSSIELISIAQNMLTLIQEFD